MLDFFAERKRLQTALLRRRSELLLQWEPLDAAWVSYALEIGNGEGGSPATADLRRRFAEWAATPSTWESERNLAPLAFAASRGYLPQSSKALRDAALLIARIDVNSRFSPLRDPELMLLLAIAIRKAGDPEVQRAVAHLLSSLKLSSSGPPKRKALLSAAARELSVRNAQGIPTLDASDEIGDVIASLWWRLRYESTESTYGHWSQFGPVWESIGFLPHEDVPEIRPLSSAETALLYECFWLESQSPDPRLLYEYYPLHPRIRIVSSHLFHKGEYFSAVFEATKVVYDELRSIAGTSESEVSLVRSLLGDPSSKMDDPPLLPFVDWPKHSRDGKSLSNAQRGWSHLLIGMFFALRHPRGHEPKDSHWGAVAPRDALDELVFISMILRAVESSKVRRKTDADRSA